MSRSKSSRAWLHEHVNDPYVLRAKQENWRSRAVFKLMEIDDKYHLLKPGTLVVDLGSAPGSWSQLAYERTKQKGQHASNINVFSLDILEMPAIPNTCFIQGDFQDDAVLKQLEDQLAGRKVTLVLSDIAPNMSGIPMVDQARGMALAELALDFAISHLKPNGDFLVKAFQGSDFQPFLGMMRSSFVRVISKKPKASRNRSAEIYLLGRQLKNMR